MPVFKVKYKNADEPLDEVEKMWLETLKDILQNENLRQLNTKKALQKAKDFDIQKIGNEWKKYYTAPLKNWIGRFGDLGEILFLMIHLLSRKGL